jgi:hypothetical protein
LLFLPLGLFSFGHPGGEKRTGATI